MSTEKPMEREAQPHTSIQGVARGIYQIHMPLSDNGIAMLSHINVYLVEGTHGWLLIDTGWYFPKAQRVMEDALKSLNLTLADISTIVITHGHPDHFGLAGRIKHLSPKTQMLMHRWESDLIESRYIKFSEPQEKMSLLLESHGVPAPLLDILGSASMPTLEFVTITLPDHVLYGGEIIHTGIYDLEVIWTPGHSPGHICLYEPQNQFLFSGDHVLPSISPNIGYHILSGDNPLGDYIYALGKLINLPISQVYPGHEYAFSDLKGRIKAIIEHHKVRENQILKLIGHRLCNAYEIASRVKWDLPDLTWEQFPPIEKRLAITETIAHVEHLRWSGKVSKVIKDNRISYSSI